MSPRVLVLLVAAASLLAAAVGVGLAGTSPRQANSDEPDIVPAAAATPAAPDEGDDGDEDGSPPDLAHRPEALGGSCLGCHRPDGGGWAQCEEGAARPEGDCRACHAPAPEPQPIVIHHMPEDETADPLCAVCHSDVVRAELPRVEVTESEECSSCHVGDLEEVLPEDHADRSVVTCTVCHQSEFLAAPSVPHQVAGWERCSFCHGEGRLTPLEGGHEGGDDEGCLSCHDDPAQPPKLQRRMLDLARAEDERCVSCHADDGLAPLPADHGGRTGELCSLCHAVDYHRAPDAPHALEDDRACRSCHVAGGTGPLPQAHEGRGERMCASCHDTVPGGVPAIPHDIDRRSDCASCHEPAEGVPDLGASGRPH